MHLLIASDYFQRQASNGVSNRVTSLYDELIVRGHRVSAVSTEQNTPPGHTMPFRQHDIHQSAELSRWQTALDALNPDVVFIMTEENVGCFVRDWCIRSGRPFQSLFTTKYPEFFAAREVITPPSYDYFRWFHAAADKIHVPTQSIKQELLDKGFPNKIVVSPHGTDVNIFHPQYAKEVDGPYVLYVGRLAMEKNVFQLLDIDTRGFPLYVIGNGPVQQQFVAKAQDKNVRLLGEIQQGRNTAKWYANAILTIFPSKLDTFGLTITESLACGTPVAAFDAPGPKDILTDPLTGTIHDDLQVSFDTTLHTHSRERCRNIAVNKYSVEKSVDVLLSNLSSLTPHC